MDVLLPFERLRKWGMKGGLAILDQGVFSGANFLLTILLARWLEASEFGQFAIGFAVLTFFIQVYTSFVLEPIGVLGTSNYADRLSSYLKSQVKLLFTLSIPLGVFLSTIVLLWRYLSDSISNSSPFLFATLGIPFVLFPLLMRRAFYVLQQPGIALAGSLVYFFCAIGGILVIKNLDLLSIESGMLLLFQSGTISGCVMLFLLQKSGAVDDEISLGGILSETWRFGRWLILSGFFIALATQSQVYLTGILSSPEDAAAVRVLQTFIQPMMLAFTAFSTLATPLISKDFTLGQYQSMRKKIYLLIFLPGIMAVLYECLLVYYGVTLNHWFFGEKYSFYADQIPIWGLVPFIWSLFWGGVIALQATKNPSTLVVISGTWAFFSLASGLVFIPVLGVRGATISIVIGFLAAFVSTWVLYWFMVHRIYIAVHEKKWIS